MTKTKLSNRIISILVCLALLLVYIPVYSTSVSAADTGFTKVSDPGTMDGWKSFFGPDVMSTENAGGVWTDKSVFTDASALPGVTKDETNSFLVALSAIGSNMTVTGASNVPTDTVLVLDVSGSMNNNRGNNNVAAQLVESANVTIESLQSMNEDSRVGVILYSGSSGSNTNDDAAVTLLPLARYTPGTTGDYLTYTLSYGDEYVGVDSGVRIAGTDTRPSTWRGSKEVVGATYIQKGVIAAMNMFQEAEITEGTTRIPVMVLLSDGAPTLATTSFTAPGQYNMGSGSSTSNGMVFVNQLSAAYAKQEIQKHYGTECLFYTLGLGVSNNVLATSVLNPATSPNYITSYWTSYNNAKKDDPILVQSDPTRNVIRLADALDFSYVDQYFGVTANTDLAAGLEEAFKEIVNTIALQTKYFPTLVDGNEDVSGYISFVDRIGEFMSVTDVKGLYINNVLYSGALLSRNFAANSDGGDLGTEQNPTALGDELVWAVQARLGLETPAQARTLIGLAYAHGQLAYTSDTNFSNYIGWYANAAGEFLGFWYDGITTMPDPSDPNLTDATRPVYIMKSYGYLGAVDAEHGVVASDMMYATVQLRQEIATGDQTMTFAVPASLVPVVTYNVTLGENDTLTNLTVTGAEHPIRLVYEVALDKRINEFNILEVVDEDYRSRHTDANGNIYFYSNQYEADNTTGYGKSNTYSYYNPSRQNDRYYYTQNAMVYTNTSGTLYNGTTRPSGTMYRQHTSYTKQAGQYKIVTGYHALTAEALGTAQRVEGTNNWYIPKGNIRMDTHLWDTEKTSNPTDTLTWSNIPFVDTSNHAVDDTGYSFIVGATLGNNGRITVTPETGIRISKELAAGAETPVAPFQFNLSGNVGTANLPAYMVPASGAAYETTVVFTDGAATVMLNAGDVLYIGGMTDGQTVTVTEVETADYYVQSVNGANGTGVTLTVADQQIASAHFINASRGKGDLTISKVIRHDLGTDYVIPEGKTFTMTVTLSGIGTANATFTTAKGGQTSQITTDANGTFQVTLEHNEQVTIYDLPEGTVATVVENDPPAGFTPQYYDNGVAGDGIVTVTADNVVSVIVRNDYVPARVYPVNVTVSGTKVLTGRDWQDDDVFTFQLQRHLGGNNWQLMSEQKVLGTDADKVFDFNGAFGSESYAEAGTYYYRVVEIQPVGNLAGVTYDTTVHAFSVIVGDANMDGTLEITEVRAARPATTHVAQTDNGYHVTVDFTNTYSTSGTATVTIDLNKTVKNDSGSPLATLSGFAFGLYNEAGERVAISEATTDRGFARMALSFDEEGTYNFTLKEIVPDPVPDGWQYSTKSYAVTVVVTDSGEGYLTAVIYLDGNDETPATSVSATFENIYVPGTAQLDIDFVSKALTGRDMVAGEFEFRIVDTATGETVRKGTNDAQGNVTFDQPLYFEAVGEYFFDIVEYGENANGVTMDKHTYRMCVTVTDVNGQLTATYELVNIQDDTITFKNTYTAASVPHSITAHKTLEGRGLMNDEFTFILTQAQDAAGTTAEGAATWQALNYVDGAIHFPAITYTAAGTYYYVITELNDGAAGAGVYYDDTAFVVTVKVTDDLKGNLEVKPENVTYTVKNGDAVEIAEFVNRYIPAAATAEIIGSKLLEGEVLGEGDFSFELYSSNNDWTAGKLLQTVKNGADGTITFDSLSFSQPGTYYYLVMEKNGGETIDRVTYDDSIYRVVITVTDNQRGQLSAEMVVFDEDELPQAGIEFVNIYTPPVIEIPETGDNVRLGLWMALLAVSGCCLVAITLTGKKRKTQ